MTPERLAQFKKGLEQRRAELLQHSSESAMTRKPVELDQQSTGRLTRQDALQQQAMANAQEARRGVEIRKIDAALQRIEEGEFGWCAKCGEAIALKRLDIDPTVICCVACTASAV